MHIQPSREDLTELTQLNPFDRFPDGRPRVPDDLLERMKLVTTEEAWAVLRHRGPAQGGDTGCDENQVLQHSCSSSVAWR